MMHFYDHDILIMHKAHNPLNNQKVELNRMSKNAGRYRPMYS